MLLSTVTLLLTTAPLASFFGMTPLIVTVSVCPAFIVPNRQTVSFGLRMHRPLEIAYSTEFIASVVTNSACTFCAVDGPALCTVTR